MDTIETKVVVRAATILGGGLIMGGLFLAIGIWLAADRLAAQLERGVTAHGVMTRDASPSLNPSCHHFATPGSSQP